MDEENIREEIARILHSKSSSTRDLSGIKINDFTFVRCANKKVRIPDGDSPFDSKGIWQTYTHGAIYVWLNKPTCKDKPCICKLHLFTKFLLLLCGFSGTRNQIFRSSF